MKATPLHYYTIRNRVTGEKSLVRAPTRQRALSGFAKLRLEAILTSQQELLDLSNAQVSVLDLSKPQPEPRNHATDDGGAAGS